MTVILIAATAFLAACQAGLPDNCGLVSVRSGDQENTRLVCNLPSDLPRR